MKRVFLLLVMAVGACSIFAQNGVIALHSSDTVQIFSGNTALNDAYTAAQNGDTLYLPGGSFATPSVFEKSLRIYGAGFFPDSTRTTGKTVISGDIKISASADNFYIEGVEFTGNVYPNNYVSTPNTDTLTNVTIAYCKLNKTLNTKMNSYGDGIVQNLLLYNNVVVGNINLEKSTNTIFANNIIVSYIERSSGNCIQNNILLRNLSIMNYDCNNNLIKNNVCIRNSEHFMYHGTNLSNLFYNNLFLMTYNSNHYGTDPIMDGNYFGVVQDSIFVSQSGNVFDYTHNYHLQHPETWIGTDGTEVGIYGGIFPWKEGAVPGNPHIRKNSTASKTDNSGMLQLDIEAVAQ